MPAFSVLKEDNITFQSKYTHLQFFLIRHFLVLKDFNRPFNLVEYKKTHSVCSWTAPATLNYYNHPFTLYCHTALNVPCNMFGPMTTS